jgi:hypothetical protein
VPTRLPERSEVPAPHGKLDQEFQIEKRRQNLRFTSALCFPKSVQGVLKRITNFEKTGTRASDLATAMEEKNPALDAGFRCAH